MGVFSTLPPSVGEVPNGRERLGDSQRHGGFISIRTYIIARILFKSLHSMSTGLAASYPREQSVPPTLLEAHKRPVSRHLLRMPPETPRLER